MVILVNFDLAVLCMGAVGGGQCSAAEAQAKHIQPCIRLKIGVYMFEHGKNASCHG